MEEQENNTIYSDLESLFILYCITKYAGKEGALDKFLFWAKYTKEYGFSSFIKYCIEYNQFSFLKLPSHDNLLLWIPALTVFYYTYCQSMPLATAIKTAEIPEKNKTSTSEFVRQLTKGVKKLTTKFTEDFYEKIAIKETKND